MPQICRHVHQGCYFFLYSYNSNPQSLKAYFNFLSHYLFQGTKGACEKNMEEAFKYSLKVRVALQRLNKSLRGYFAILIVKLPLQACELGNMAGCVNVSTFHSFIFTIYLMIINLAFQLLELGEHDVCQGRGHRQESSCS